MSGKSTLAARTGLPHYCTDPKSLARNQSDKTNYLPEGLKWGDDSEYIANNWLTMQGSWVIEGVGAVRALRKWALKYPVTMPADKIIVIKGHADAVTDGQFTMGKSVSKIWNDISNTFAPITQYIE